MPGNWFSNFIPFDNPVVINNITFKTPEHLYQSLKATNMNDVMTIASCETPGQAKRKARKIKLRDDWEEVKLDIMYFVITKKFTKKSKAGQKLINSGETIVEWNNWHDNFWGHCTCNNCKNIEKENHLGKLLERRREELKNLVYVF